MSESTVPFWQPEAMSIVYAAALEAFISGDAVVSEDGNEVRWAEPICDPAADRLIGISRCDGGWSPLVEAGVHE